MKKRGLLLESEKEELLDVLSRVRFNRNKARYIEDARRAFLMDGRLILRKKLSTLSDPMEKREWLVREVKGFGYKEASHFLRNIGHGENLAILDRHILKNLFSLRLIRQVPKSVSRRRYLSIEMRMREFSRAVNIPMGHLDLLLWFNETGEIFK